MVELDFKRCALPPYQHQATGVKRLIAAPRYGLFWEMRLGKTKAIIDAACFLREAGMLDAVVIACPAQVQDVWLHKKVGEVQKHCWQEHSRLQVATEREELLELLVQSEPGLQFISVSHELLRQEDRSSDFPKALRLSGALEGNRVWLVYDEASAFGNHKSLQFKSAARLAGLLPNAKVTLLDGTPVGNDPVCQYAKFKLLGPDILGYKNFFHFRAVHQVAEPNIYAKRKKKYVGFKAQELIDRRVRPYCWYLEQKDVLDMPKKVKQPMVVRLSKKTWAAYVGMRDEMLAELDCGLLTANHASVKTLRLAQLCAGIAGGVELEGEFMESAPTAVTISTETDDALVEWLGRRQAEDPLFKCVIWARWRPQIERLYGRLMNRQADYGVGLVYGSKKVYNNELHPDSQYGHGFVLVAQPQAMRFGVNLSRATTEVFLSQDYNLITRQQSEDRIQDPNSTRKTSLMVEALVEGPDGQRTVTWDVQRALDEREVVARRTAGEWKKAIE